MAILVTGGAGFIGTHTIIELIQAGYDAVILDNFVNTSANAVKRVEEITGKKIPCYDGDIADRDIYKEIFADNVIEACIHFAGLKAVGESVKKPLEYYENNVSGSIVLFDELRKRGVKKLKVVYSEEIPMVPNKGRAVPSQKRQTPGSISFVPPVAGMIIGGEVIKDLTGLN